MRSFYFAVAALLGALAFAQPASAAVIYTNTNGGNGYAVGTSTLYTIYGSNNGLGTYDVHTGTCSPADSCFNYTYTTATATAATDMTLTFEYSYTTHDSWTSYWDPAGYVINGAYTQLTPTVDPYWYNANPGVRDYSGVVTLTILAGQTYGFYVYSLDGVCGFAEITVSLIPLPAALPLFGSALLGLGAIARRKRA